MFFDGIGALENPDKNISFNDLTDKAIKAQKWLDLKGFKRGDAVLLFETPAPDMYAMILAMLASGLRLMLVEPWMPLTNLNHLINEVRPKGFMTKTFGKVWGMRSKAVRNIPITFSSKELRAVQLTNDDSIRVEDMHQDEHAILTFTSGTSGTPKGVHRKHQYLVDQAAVLKKHLHYEDKHGLDLTIFTNVTLLNLGLGKGSLLIPPRWPKKVLKDLDKLPESYKVDTLAAGPGFLIRLMKYAQVKSLKSLHLGGALADCWIYEQALERWPSAHMTHVYGSSEAEPVAISDLKIAVNKSRDKGYFQTLYLGKPINDIKLDIEEDRLWVSGIHVSPLYEGDAIANKKNKRIDSDNVVWHNMGDRVQLEEDSLWYSGREFQSLEDFSLEQSIYCALGHSKCMVHRIDNDVVLIGELTKNQKIIINQSFPLVSRVTCSKIFRDKRHRARIDRVKTLKRAGYASV